MYEPKTNHRKEYRKQETQKVLDSATLSQTFPALNSLTLELMYFSPTSLTRSSELKYTVNLSNAKSRFCFACSNDQCVGGDFDLSAILAATVAGRRAKVAGEMMCQGWRSGTTIGQIRCNHVLRYTINAEDAHKSRPIESEHTILSGA